MASGGERSALGVGGDLDGPGFRLAWSTWITRPTQTAPQYDNLSVDLQIVRKTNIPKNIPSDGESHFTRQNERSTTIDVLVCKFSCIVSAIGKRTR